MFNNYILKRMMNWAHKIMDRLYWLKTFFESGKSLPVIIFLFFRNEKMKFPSTLSHLEPLRYCRASTAEHVLKHSSDKPVGRQEKRNELNHPEYLAIKNTVSMGWTVTNKSSPSISWILPYQQLTQREHFIYQTHSRVIRKRDSFYPYWGERKDGRIWCEEA